MAVIAERREAVPVRIPRAGGEYEAVILIEHADGLVGLGEAPVVPGRQGSLEDLVAELGGTRPPQSPAARCALETARLDLEARRAGRPLAELLGTPRRREVECCALVMAVRPDLVARETESRAAAGFTSFKLKKANGGGMLDQERLGAARWAAGRGARLRLDFNGRLTPAEAAARLPSLAPFRLELAEQPLPPAAPALAWQVLSGSVGVPLTADESLADPELAAQLAGVGVGLALKLATVGGSVPACRLAAGARGPVTVGSSFETSIGLAAALHLACVLEREPLPCGLATSPLLDEDPVQGLALEGARLRLPPGPGLGVSLDRPALDHYRLDR